MTLHPSIDFDDREIITATHRIASLSFRKARAPKEIIEYAMVQVHRELERELRARGQVDQSPGIDIVIDVRATVEVPKP